jgi:hypothetical protein
MINSDVKLPCGSRLQMVRHGRGRPIYISISPPENQSLLDIAQVRDNKITLAFTPETVSALKPLFRAFIGREPLSQRLRNLFGLL